MLHQSAAPEDAIVPFLSWVDARRAAAVEPDVCLSAAAFRTRLRRMIGTAPGVDRWSAEAFLRLPDHFLECLVLVWDAVLAGAPVPRAWTNVRVVLIPKEGGGERPISVTSICWRLGATVIVRQLRPWIRSWVTDAVAGAVPDKSVHTVADIDEALVAHRPASVLIW